MVKYTTFSQRFPIIKYIFLFIPFYLFATPVWFHNIPHKNYELVAYGVDKNLQTARDIAKSELSKQIKVEISSNTNIDKYITNGAYNRSIKNSIQTSSNATLQGIEILKESIDGSFWYVSVKYDNRTLLQKIKAQQKNIQASRVSNSYLNFTLLGRKIYKTLGYFPSLHLVRKNNFWYIEVDSKLFLLNQKDFVKLFSNTKSQNLKLSTNKRIYKYPEEIVFQIDTKKEGYISLLYSEQSGKVGIIAQNIKIQNRLIFPALNAEDKLIAFNPTKNTLKELYVAIYSKEKINLRAFEQISDNLLDESNYNFDKLLDILKKTKYSSVKLKIRGK